MSTETKEKKTRIRKPALPTADKIVETIGTLTLVEVIAVYKAAVGRKEQLQLDAETQLKMLGEL